MKLLIADDDVFFRRLLERMLEDDYELVSVKDGEQAWEYLQSPDSPRLAVLDWVMPKLTGPQLCRRVRESRRLDSIYLIILTAKNDTASLVSALQAGADDYVTKPFEPNELHARIRVGARVVELQNKLTTQIAQLENTLARVEQLQSLLPICPTCRVARTDTHYKDAIDAYIREHSDTFVHGYCPSCVMRGTDPLPREIDQIGDQP